MNMTKILGRALFTACCLAAARGWAQFHPADLNGNRIIERAELNLFFNLGLDVETDYLRAVQFYNAGGYVVDASTFDGFAPSPLTYLVFDLQALTMERLTEAPPGGWTDAHKTTKLVLRRIPAGRFDMGSPANEFGRKANETQHPAVVSKDYFIGVFAVTQRQWELVMNTRPSYYNNALVYADRPVEQVSYEMIRGKTADGANWPANANVGAASFMGKLRAKFAGVVELDFDLPTEAQWELACRAGTTSSIGVKVNGVEVNVTNGQCPNFDAVARYRWNCGYTGSNTMPPRDADADKGTAPSGSFAPNAWGLYDMHGNVAEWCLDWLGNFTAAEAVDPKGAATGTQRVLRGGSWSQNALEGRSAARQGAAPNFAGSSGLRVCAPVPKD